MSIRIVSNSISDQLFIAVKRMILAGEIKCGERISEEKLSMEFGVSRTPVREALKRLQSYGLIVMKPRSYSEVILLDDEEIFQIAQARAEIESGIVRLLIQRIDEEMIARLEEICKKCTEDIGRHDLAATFERDSFFHMEMAHMGHNRYLYHAMESLDAKIQLYRIMRCKQEEHVIASITQHYSILEAVRKRDVELACSEVRKHALSMIGNG